nr:MAG TPA: hypothetical protein [Bacteriophage sp.]
MFKLLTVRRNILNFCLGFWLRFANWSLLSI